jgi:hypothetical protein
VLHEVVNVANRAYSPMFKGRDVAPVVATFIALIYTLPEEIADSTVDIFVPDRVPYLPIGRDLTALRRNSVADLAFK